MSTTDQPPHPVTSADRALAERALALFDATSEAHELEPELRCRPLSLLAAPLASAGSNSLAPCTSRRCRLPVWAPTSDSQVDARAGTPFVGPPERIQGRVWARGLFAWYNHEHHHSGLAQLTPAQVHQGLTARVLAARKRVLAAAYAKHPERFVRGEPSPAQPPSEVWSNPPAAPAATSVSAASNPASDLPLLGGLSRGNSEAALDRPQSAATLGQVRRTSRSQQQSTHLDLRAGLFQGYGSPASRVNRGSQALGLVY